MCCRPSAACARQRDPTHPSPKRSEAPESESSLTLRVGPPLLPDSESQATFPRCASGSDSLFSIFVIIFQQVEGFPRRRGEHLGRSPRRAAGLPGRALAGVIQPIRARSGARVLAPLRARIRFTHPSSSSFNNSGVPNCDRSMLPRCSPSISLMRASISRNFTTIASRRDWVSSLGRGRGTSG